jgi:hypothetical protein
MSTLAIVLLIVFGPVVLFGITVLIITLFGWLALRGAGKPTQTSNSASSLGSANDASEKPVPSIEDSNIKSDNEREIAIPLVSTKDETKLISLVTPAPPSKPTSPLTQQSRQTVLSTDTSAGSILQGLGVYTAKPTADSSKTTATTNAFIDSIMPKKTVGSVMLGALASDPKAPSYVETKDMTDRINASLAGAGVVPKTKPTSPTTILGNVANALANMRTQAQQQSNQGPLQSASAPKTSVAPKKTVKIPPPTKSAAEQVMDRLKGTIAAKPKPKKTSADAVNAALAKMGMVKR